MPADPTLRFDGPPTAAITVALAHGAGAGMDTPFMHFFAAELANHGLRVARFEFPYMAAYRDTGARKPPDREPVLRDAWLQVIQKLGPEQLIIGGKSMGGRIASLVADGAGVAGLICLGYPFHPVGKPERLRVQHLTTIRTATLILQGERDPFGDRTAVQGYQLSSAIEVRWLKDGDHSFKPRKSSGQTERQNWQTAIEDIVRFAGSLPAAGETK
ncbi:MAG TPA: alpha/beta fold hydrolase [Gemmataceae bacterium]|nr:alpha/beta fold hydrolase [Gemmataceae bacterium]